ncbi:hypothetical protein IM511_04475 [Erythrobacteraceae bacterium E2-1 Yellow Sea]|nr:hypothetical protein [Erythrobacteraceae bacterium E2-1 Yellow Sea]
MIQEPEFILFASDATLMALWGVGFVLLSMAAMWAEHRRKLQHPLARISKVGWVPWTSVYMGCLLIGGGLLAYSLPTVLFG